MITNNRKRSIRRMFLRPSGILFLIRLLAWAAVLSYIQAVPVQAARQEFPAPKWLENVSVSDQMIINGLPSSVQYFEAFRQLDDLLDYYRQRWQDGRAGKPGYREMEAAPWHIITKLDGRYLYTVQAQKNGPFGIRGYLAIADLKGAGEKNRTIRDAPMMKGSRVINHSTSIDPGRKGRTLLLANSFSIAGNSEYYRNHYRERGWAKLVDMENEQARVLTFKKRGREAHFVIRHIGDETRIVMNTVEPD